MLQWVFPGDKSEQVPALPSPGGSPEPHAVRWPVRARGSSWPAAERPLEQADSFQTHLSRWFTVFFASLRFLFLEQLTREMATTREHSSPAGALQQLVNHLRTMWLRPCDVDGAGARTQGLGSRSAAWPGRGTGARKVGPRSPWVRCPQIWCRGGWVGGAAGVLGTGRSPLPGFPDVRSCYGDAAPQEFADVSAE